uniref:Uncharacterized protein n=1 Tax=Crocodylus porosus TaxID=8502 RepID=A0A7M4EU68_CROPO
LFLCHLQGKHSLVLQKTYSRGESKHLDSLSYCSPFSIRLIGTSNMIPDDLNPEHKSFRHSGKRLEKPTLTWEMLEGSRAGLQLYHNPLSNGQPL